MSEDKEPFLSRWSRLKTEAREAPDEPAQEAGGAALPVGGASSAKGADGPPASEPLPPVNELTPESDFKPFMHPQVDPGTRRAALKRLFADSRFNVPDPFEAYSEDYTGGEPIPMEMLKTLNQAKKLLFDDAEKSAQAGTEKAQQAPEGPGGAEGPGSPEGPQGPQNGAARQDA